MKNELQAAIREIEERQVQVNDESTEATKNELQAMIREIDERQVRQTNECKIEAKAQVEATKNELQSMIREIDERQVKQHQECKTEAKTDLQVIKTELQAMIRKIDERQVKQLDEYKGELHSQAQAAKGEQQAAIEEREKLNSQAEELRMAEMIRRAEEENLRYKEHELECQQRQVLASRRNVALAQCGILSSVMSAEAGAQVCMANEDSDQESWASEESSVKVPAASAVQSDEVANTAPVVEAEESLGHGVADNVEKACNKMDEVCSRLGCASELASRCVGTMEKALEASTTAAKKKAAECANIAEPASANASWAGERDLSKAEPVLKENSDLIATSNTVKKINRKNAGAQDVARVALKELN